MVQSNLIFYGKPMQVFKYRTFSSETTQRDINSLVENSFWCSPRERLNDLCEGFFTDNKLKEELNAFKLLSDLSKAKVNFDDFHQSIENVKNLLLNQGIFSTSKSPFIHTLWSLYADSHQGFCIEYDLDDLVAKNPSYYQSFDVHYLDEPQDLSLADMQLNNKDNNSHMIFLQKVIGTKHKDWSNEQEVRIISSVVGKNYHRQSAIKAIYFGQNCSVENKNLLMKELANRNITFKEIAKIKNSFNLSAVDMINPFDDDKLTKGKLAKIEEFAIYENGIKEEYRQHIPYLRKVAKIMQKDPDCEVIECIDFSTDSTLDNPIIFINFQEKNKPLVNSVKRFTLSEIDNILGK